MSRCFALVAVLILVTVAAGCSSVPGTGGHVSGSGNPTTKQYDYSGFTGLRVDNAFAATVTRGDAYAVQVTVDDNLVKYLRVELDGDMLHIGLDPSMSYQNTSLRAKVILPRLRALEVSGASTADVKGFASHDALDLQVSGGARIDLMSLSAGGVTMDVSGAGRLSGQLEAQGITAEVSGAGRVHLKGLASKAELEASGAGQLDLARLTVRDANIELSGGASGMVDVTGTLRVEASGGAHLDFYGTPDHKIIYLSGGAQVGPAGG